MAYLKRCCHYIVTLGLMIVAHPMFAQGVLVPKGIIALTEHKLMFDTIALMLIVVLPVIAMSFAFAQRFRESNRPNEYQPEWCHNTLLEVFWWGIPALIILALAVMTWHKTHELDPYKPLAVGGEPEQIDVVALRWKWLFIYPKEGIATVNDLYLPAKQQIRFHITADAPMSSFHIPQLGGQIYAMAGMRTKLHLYSKHLGTYEGLNTQLNGRGFSHMHFPVHVVEKSAFKRWAHHIKTTSAPLTIHDYGALYQPTIDAPPMHFGQVPPQLFKRIMQQYMQANSMLHAREDHGAPYA